MDKIIWILEENRNKMLELQRKINSYGGMRALCFLSVKAMENVILERVDKGMDSRSNPSLVLMDYDVISEDESALRVLKSHPKLAGVPLFLLVEDNQNSNEEYYYKGVMVVLKKKLSNSDIIRIERAAWQYEVTKSYEYVLQKQETELRMAKKIKKLNEQLENRNKFLHTIFGKYFPDEFIEILLDKKEDELLGGDRRHIAVLFCDLRGFSAIAEEISGEKMTDLLNCFFGEMLEGIIKYHGTVIEYMGDGVLAVFGAPVKDDNYCENSVAAAITMQNSMPRVNDYCAKMGYPKLNLGIAIHCGEGFVGNIGTEKMMRYNVIGNVVNVCSRIEGCSLGGQVLISQELKERLKVPIKIKESSSIFAKGIRNSIEIYQVQGIGGNYSCYLNNSKPPKSYELESAEYINVHKIHNKVVDGYGSKMQLLRISGDELLFNQPETGRRFRDTEVYSDVELRSDVFIGAYAKVIKVEEDKVTVHVTRKSKDFVAYINKLIRHIISMEAEKLSSIEIEQLHNEFIIQKVSKDVLADDELFSQNRKGRFDMMWSLVDEDVMVRFQSDDKAVRALEFLDYLMGEFGMIKGDERLAGGMISVLILKALMSDMDEEDIEEFFVRKVRMYFNRCDWIFADEYVKDNKEKILSLPKYSKKMVSWAYVRTVDIAPVGTKFTFRSLENESDMEMVSSEDLYIMIGSLGETYYISRDKFMRTYNTTDENFDVFEKLPVYMPDVRISATGDYISLDDKARLCYPKTGASIYAKPLEYRTKVFSKENQGEYFVGNEGDYLALRVDDIEDIYIIQREIFEETYVLQDE